MTPLLVSDFDAGQPPEFRRILQLNLLIYDRDGLPPIAGLAMKMSPMPRLAVPLGEVSRLVCVTE
jgi:hypothetical protein